MKPYIVMGVVLVILWPIVVTALALLGTGRVSFSLNGFAVDSTGKLYVGKEQWIEVYEDGIMKTKIDPMTSRGYYFTIQNDKILLSTGSTIYHMELNGEVISQEDDLYSSVYTQIQWNYKKFITDNKDVYKIKKHRGRYEIVRYNHDKTEVIYRMPCLDYVLHELVVLNYTIMVFYVPTLLYKIKKREKSAEKVKNTSLI